MKTYVTFGQAHVHRVNNITFDADSVAVIEAPTAADGRARALECFKTGFFTTYTEKQWNEDNLKWFPRGYIEVKE